MTQRNNQKENLTLTNGGVRLYSFYTPLHSFSLSLYIPAGPMYERADEAGISHFFEHAVFRNLNSLMGGELYTLLDRYGLTLSGSTSNELIQFSIQGAPKYFEKACEILTTVLADFNVSASEIALERERVKREIREDSYRSSVDFLLQKTLWQNTGLSETITGRVGTLAHFTLKKLHSFKERFVTSNNIFFYLTGAFEEKGIEFLKACVEKYSLPKGEVLGNRARVPDSFFKRDGTVVAKRADFCKVKLSFDVDTEKIKKPVRDLVFDILFQGDTSRVFIELSEKRGFVYSFDANFEEYRNIGAITLAFETSHADFEEALSAVFEIFRSMKEEECPERLALSKVPYTENFEFILDDAENLNWNKAYESKFLGFEYSTLEERRDEYMRVSATDVRLASGEIFKKENLTVAIKHKKPDQAEKIVREVVECFL